MTIIGTDGGLVPTPIPVTTFRHGVAERYEVVIDFKNYPVGTRIILRNGNIENDINFTNTNKVMAFDVIGDASDPSERPRLRRTGLPPRRPRVGRRCDSSAGTSLRSGHRSPAGRRADHAWAGRARSVIWAHCVPNPRLGGHRTPAGDHPASGAPSITVTHRAGMRPRRTRARHVNDSTDVSQALGNRTHDGGAAGSFSGRQ
jgi:FtsP/CotA-like multicopper oxidase with cupredoxin domain